MISNYLQGMVAAYRKKGEETYPEGLSEFARESWNDGWCDYQLMCEEVARQEKPNMFRDTLIKICGNEGLTLADLGV
jgi:hypothetical protein